MDEHDLSSRIAEIRSYIASDWPDVEERKRLYEEIKELENRIADADGIHEKPEADSTTHGQSIGLVIPTLGDI